MHIENCTFDELQVGDSRELRRLCTQDDLLVFANVSGNHNPMHLYDADGDGDGMVEAVAPGMFVGALVSAVLGNLLPGAGTLYRAQSMVFHARAHAGDELVSRVTVTDKNERDSTVTLATEVRRLGDDALILSGAATVEAPRKKISYSSHDLPGLIVQRHRHFEKLLKLAAPLPALKTAVVCPEEPNSLGGALLARSHTLIAPILVGDATRIAACAAEIGADLTGVEIIDEPDHQTAAHRAVALVGEGRAEALMKGHLHTDQLLRATLDKQAGLRAGRRFTHVFVMDVPGLAHPLLVTDAAINISPDLKTKVDIVQNAIDLALSIGIEQPKVGVLSAVETVNPDLPSSIDGALLSKMAERGQITGGLVDGPLAMDNAVDIAAARTKGLTSPVAGHADVLVVPDIDAGNMLAKQLTYLSHAEGAGLVLGARVPIILNSRSDDDMSRLASCAVAALHHFRLKGGA
ncbi:bifunctional enoyl-CoA hydratase/phosphate acetyltransferase [Lutimaribacter sp. EGI FJ00015]|uniref:Bifunctional enoyl-CoA hydratase/phosphate acetyltransferase n=1 Tax=Lutimaribacter degradans TaxID=2945989 RepID=A0ACC5ZWD4_9RHOB|nr:bifunctional enoyl-CoA hydratase/phosphate acetyltransferase [Lutimaribacter sp. EGI FJ00013]MCM2561719.1 bifunctional enoyl-CoA hydratase/phosphate acetyltransferase [Lutimaribacter sp. EGI FJ00013]MCO0612568.1 bifunctional enoyl-CoA hydratase/phosphate acetyltransferase [Lutimaribacter sp. EGI FJ00015]MCO0635227.1 bifunctional enoyl-CoA hydratase/phosphate acetyltransferase [Lutimaribacter sp. EGI FJ00014]